MRLIGAHRRVAGPARLTTHGHFASIEQIKFQAVDMEIPRMRQEATVLMVTLASVWNLASANQTCESLATLTLPDTTITQAESVAAGAFLLPGRSGQTAGRPGPDFKALPTFCRVAATIKPTTDSDIKIEVWIP